MVFLRRPHSRRILTALMTGTAFAICPYAAKAADYPDAPSVSNYGGAGLLDTRTARMFPDGYMNFTAAITEPDQRYALTFQGLPWVEFTFRYLRDQSWPEGTQYFRNFDLKVRLSNESEYWPEIAGGLQDFVGLREYGAEYFVASKRWNDFDFSFGIGWGRLGSNGTFENPFGLITNSFLYRSDSFNGTGGSVLFNSFFHGQDAGLFGGVDYITPVPGLDFKVEYSSDAYPTERMTGKNYGFPVNAGFSYRADSWLDVGVSWMHGHYLGLRVTALMDVKHDAFPARIDPPPRFTARPEQPAGTILQPGTSVPVAQPDAASDQANARAAQTNFVDLTRERDGANAAVDVASAALSPPPAVVPPAAAEQPRPAPPQLAEAVQQAVRRGLDTQKLALMGLSRNGDRLIILIENPRYRRSTEAISRAARVLSATAPADINSFEITLLVTGQSVATVTLQRDKIDAIARHEGSPAELFQSAELGPGQSAPLDHIAPGLFPQLNTLIFPLLQESLFDPNNPVYVRVGVGAGEELRLTRNWFLDLTGFATIWDDFSQITRTSNSVLPHVRSDINEYLKDGRYGIANFSTSYYFKLAPELYGRVSGGILEQMYDGAGGELLYRPFNARWAVGLDAWDVIQRGYRELWDLRKYQAFTGHITAYYQLPWYNLGASVSYGQYLAGDRGATFQFWRVFSTGVQVGAWLTLTNVSAARFGEGSFDKGIELIIPLEWVVPFSSRAAYDLQLRPIQRDGGQRLLGDMQLYGMTNGTDYGAFAGDWNRLYQ